MRAEGSRPLYPSGPGPTGKARGGPGANERGIALVLTIWVLAILAVIAGEFIYSSRLRVKANRNVMEQTRAYALALAGYSAALEFIGPDLRALTRNDAGELVGHYREGEPGVVAALEEASFGEGGFSFSLDDEDGKIDLNRQGRPVLTTLLKEAGQEYGAERDTLIDSILDWRDPNREHRLNGAEEDYYQALDPPYSCQDGPFDVKEELLLVRGMKEEYLYGGTIGEKELPALEDWITVYPVVFNPSTAPDEVLKILKRPRPARPGKISQYFTIVATGKLGEAGAERSVKAVVRREGSGSNIDFQLLYWNDNYFPRKTEHAVD